MSVAEDFDLEFLGLSFHVNEQNKMCLCASFYMLSLKEYKQYP